MRMILFISIFLTIYGGLHGYALLKFEHVLPIKGVYTIPAGLFLSVMVLCPILIRVLESAEFERTARFLAYTGYTWMGFVFLFCSISLVFDIARWAGRLYAFIFQKDGVFSIPSPATAGTVAMALALMITLYALFEAKHIRTEHIVIPVPKIHGSTERIRIAQISDVHLGLIVREKRLKKILDAVTAQQPDVLVSTGDLLDGQLNDMSGVAAMLQDVRPRYGKYAVTGNHEYYAGLSRCLEFTRNAGFTVLRNRAEKISDSLYIAGVDDSGRHHVTPDDRKVNTDFLSRLPEDAFTVLLKHQPRTASPEASHIDLQLSGHTHKGQIFPFTLLVRLFYPYDAGLYEFDDGHRLYTSRGSGTWGPPMRFLAPPEVTIIDLHFRGRS